VKLLDVAFTPQIFDPSRASTPEEWRDSIMELTMLLFKGAGPPPLAVCNFQALVDGSQWEWESVASEFVKKIEDPRLRTKAEGLLTMLKGVLVRRQPLKGIRSVGDEPMWVGSIAESHNFIPFDGIVAQKLGAGGKSGHVTPLPAAAKMVHEQLTRVDTASSASRAIADELRVLFRYSERIIMTMPYAPCQPFAVECLEHHLRSKQYSNVSHVDIHVRGQLNPTNYANDWRKRLSNLNDSVSVTCHFWPKECFARERVILGCSWVDVGEGRTRSKVRWGVSFTHFPDEGDDEGKQPITRVLIAKNEAALHLKYLTENLTERNVVSIEL
jgi:hypothetical protein